jgi:hypothetical protein
MPERRKRNLKDTSLDNALPIAPQSKKTRSSIELAMMVHNTHTDLRPTPENDLEAIVSSPDGGAIANVCLPFPSRSRWHAHSDLYTDFNIRFRGCHSIGPHRRRGRRQLDCDQF